jgi:hypothetical protein
MHSEMRWRRVFLGSALVAVLAVAGLATPLALHRLEQEAARRAAEPSPTVAPISVQREIARQIVLDFTGSATPSEPTRRGPVSVVLIGSTIAFCAVEVSKIRPACPPDHYQEYIASVDLDLELPRQLRRELIAANLSSMPVPDPAMPSAIYRSRQSLGDAIVGRNATENFDREFPDSDGYLELSRAVLSRDGNHALIYVSFRCGSLCGHGTLRYFARTPTGWRLSKRVLIWVS